MRMLFEIDTKDYDSKGSSFTRPAARGIIIRDGKAAMVHSRKYHYYKFPGGGIEAGEGKEDALVREVLEETGLCVIPDTIQEYGQVYSIQKGEQEDIFIQHNYYFLCGAGAEAQPQNLDDYEADEGFILEYLSPQAAISANQKNHSKAVDQVMLDRETRVLELLLAEGYFAEGGA